MSSSGGYIQKHRQYTENNLMHNALSYCDAFRPYSMVSLGGNNTIRVYRPLKQNMHIVQLSKNTGRKLLQYVHLVSLCTMHFLLVLTEKERIIC